MRKPGRAIPIRLVAMTVVLLVPASLSSSTSGAVPLPPAGTELWSIDQDVEAEDHLADVVADPEGNSVYLVGSATDPDGPFWESTSLVVSSLNAATGASQWLVRTEIVNGTGQTAEGPVLALLDHWGGDIGRLYVIGTAANSREGIFIQTYRSFDGGLAGIGHFQITPWRNEVRDACFSEGAIFLTGVVGTPGQGGDPYGALLTMKVRTSDLGVEWSKAFSPSSTDSTDEIGRAIDVSADGSLVFVTGSSDRGPYLRGPAMTIAYDAKTGERVWMRAFGTDARNASGDDIQFAHGSVFVTGRVDGDFVTAAYDAKTGATLWRSGYNGSGDGRDYAQALTITSGRVIVSGRAMEERRAVTTVAYDMESGREAWVRSVRGWWALKLAPQPGSDDVVLRNDQGGFPGAPQVLALDSTDGAIVWAQEEPALQADQTQAGMALSGDGSTLYLGTTPQVPSSAGSWADLRVAAIALPVD